MRTRDRVFSSFPLVIAIRIVSIFVAWFGKWLSRLGANRSASIPLIRFDEDRCEQEISQNIDRFDICVASFNLTIDEDRS